MLSLFYGVSERRQVRHENYYFFLRYALLGSDHFINIEIGGRGRGPAESSAQTCKFGFSIISPRYGPLIVGNPQTVYPRQRELRLFFARRAT